MLGVLATKILLIHKFYFIFLAYFVNFAADRVLLSNHIACVLAHCLIKKYFYGVGENIPTYELVHYFLTVHTLCFDFLIYALNYMFK